MCQVPKVNILYHLSHQQPPPETVVVNPVAIWHRLNSKTLATVMSNCYNNRHQDGQAAVVFVFDLVIPVTKNSPLYTKGCCVINRSENDDPHTSS